MRSATAHFSIRVPRVEIKVEADHTNDSPQKRASQIDDTRYPASGGPQGGVLAPLRAFLQRPITDGHLEFLGFLATRIPSRFPHAFRNSWQSPYCYPVQYSDTSLASTTSNWIPCGATGSDVCFYGIPSRSPGPSCCLQKRCPERGKATRCLDGFHARSIAVETFEFGGGAYLF